MKGLAAAVQSALTDFYADAFDGGQSITLGAAEEAIGLPTATASWRFATFTVAAYEALFDDVADGTIVVPTTGALLSTYITGLGYTVPAGLLAKINPET